MAAPVDQIPCLQAITADKEIESRLNCPLRIARKAGAVRVMIRASVLRSCDRSRPMRDFQAFCKRGARAGVQQTINSRSLPDAPRASTQPPQPAAAPRPPHVGSENDDSGCWPCGRLIGLLRGWLTGIIRGRARGLGAQAERKGGWQTWGSEWKWCRAGSIPEKFRFTVREARGEVINKVMGKRSRALEEQAAADQLLGETRHFVTGVLRSKRLAVARS